ncbi:DUF3786 domain-containing protein [Chloroflexota bacterium]
MDNANNDEYGYELAFKLACEKLVKLNNMEQQCLKSDAGYQVMNSKKIINLEYLNRLYQIILPNIEILLTNNEEKVPLKDKILILHYLTQAKGTPLSNKLITYKELPDGATYFPTFSKRAIRPIVDHFGKEPHLLVDTAAKLGGKKANYGDVAVTIKAFSRVPITFILWRGDDEFTPEGNILFNSTVSDYLSIEDINVLSEAIAWRLVKLLKAGGDNHISRN